MKTFIVSNPKSERFLVKLMPSQNLRLDLDNKDQMLLVENEFLDYRSLENDKCKSVIISPVGELEKYSHLSTHFLGKIQLVNTQISLLVYLYDSDSKRKNVVTLINPYYQDLRLKPNEYIEVLLSTSTGVYKNDITYQWSPNRLEDKSIAGINLEQICYKCSTAGFNCNTSSDSLFYPHDRELFKQGTKLHHIWFKFDKNIMYSLYNNIRNCFIGTLNVNIKSLKENMIYTINIYCDLLSKYNSPVLNYLEHKEDEDKKDRYESKYSSVGNYPSTYNYNTNYTPKVKTPKKHKVSLTNIEFTSMLDNCKRATFTPVKVVSVPVKTTGSSVVSKEPSSSVIVSSASNNWGKISNK